MKKVYWRLQGISRAELVLVALLAFAGLIAVEVFPVVKRQAHFREKRVAARLAQRAMETLKEERLQRRIPINTEADPTSSGIIGDLFSPIVSNNGYLPSKQTTINPNFAALVVHFLKQAELEPGDQIAVGLSGSFPAINLAVFAAAETMKLEPIVISSTSASQWGATNPSFAWLDMERVLQEKRVFSFRSVAGSRGGIDDRGLGMTKEGKQALDKIMARNGVYALTPRSYEESVDLRMGVYSERAGERPIKAYVNVGGGTASVGTRVGKRLFHSGLNRSAPVSAEPLDSVMMRFAEQGVPVIHLVRFVQLAERYGFPVQPTDMPAVGEGKIFVRVQYNTWLAAAVLVVLLGALVACSRLHIGVRLAAMRSRRPAGRPRPREMV